jgi:hypothetical protein
MARRKIFAVTTPQRSSASMQQPRRRNPGRRLPRFRAMEPDVTFLNDTAMAMARRREQREDDR